MAKKKRKWPDKKSKKRKSDGERSRKSIEDLTESELRQILRIIDLKKKHKAHERARKRRRGKPRQWPTKY